MRTWEIYAIEDPRTRIVRYVGVTFRPKRRLNEHLCRARQGGRTHRDCWIRSLLSLDLQPMLVQLESGTGEWREAERRWIAHYRLHTKLVNHTDGGEGTPGYVPTPELRAKWSLSRRGRRYAAGRRSGMFGKTHSPETRARIAAAGEGRVQPPEARAKVSEARRGKPLSPEHREKLSKAKRGRTLPAEHRAKIAASTKTRRPVRCEDTGETFESMTAAARALGVTESSIYHALRKGCRCRGRRLRRA